MKKEIKDNILVIFVLIGINIEGLRSWKLRVWTKPPLFKERIDGNTNFFKDGISIKKWLNIAEKKCKMFLI